LLARLERRKPSEQLQPTSMLAFRDLRGFESSTTTAVKKLEIDDDP
jgi:hypothetical protein